MSVTRDVVRRLHLGSGTSESLEMSSSYLALYDITNDTVAKYHYSQNVSKLRRPGIEPGPPAWKAGIITIRLTAHKDTLAGGDLQPKEYCCES